MSNTFYVIPKDSDLTHYGVLGMKWGVRRYQNADGSLTAAGQRRYQGKETANARRVRSFTRSAVGSLFGGGLGSLIGIASAHADNQQKINQRHLENDMTSIQESRIWDKPNQKYMTAESTIARNLYKNVNPDASPEQIRNALSKSYKEAQKRKNAKDIFTIAASIGLMVAGVAYEVQTIREDERKFNDSMKSANAAIENLENFRNNIKLRQMNASTSTPKLDDYLKNVDKQIDESRNRRIQSQKNLIDLGKDISDLIDDLNVSNAAAQARSSVSQFSEVEIDDLLKNWKRDDGNN